MTQKKAPEVEGQTKPEELPLWGRVLGGIGTVAGIIGLVVSSSVYLWADYEKYVYRLLFFAIYVLLFAIAVMLIVKRRTIGTLLVVAIFAIVLIVPLNLIF